MDEAAADATVLGLKSVIENQLNEPLPPFVYSILVAAKLKLVANRLEAILVNSQELSDDELVLAAQAEIEGIRAVAKVVEDGELRV